MNAKDLFSQFSNSLFKTDNFWNVRQNDSLDLRTRFIYDILSVEDLIEATKKSSLNNLEKDYAHHRWRNFKRHDAWLTLILETFPESRLSKNQKDRTADFELLIDSEFVSFDLKVTRYPKSCQSGLSELELAYWMYSNQSRQGRFHLRNRFFVIGIPEAAVYDYDKALTNLATLKDRLSSKVQEITISNSHCKSITLLQK